MKRFYSAALTLALCVGCVACSSPKLSEEEEEKLEQYGMDLAMHQQFLMTRDLSLNYVPTGRLLQAEDERARMITTGRTASLTWQERGPVNIGGRTRAILVDRRDATGNTVFAASVSGGIFRTTNFNAATVVWTPVAEKMANLAVNCMWQSRSNANVFFAGTGEGYFNVDAARGAGVFRSTDGGVTWAQIPSTADFEFCQDIVEDNNNNLYLSLRNATTLNRGVMRSTDGGNTWTQVLGLPLSSLPFGTGRAGDLEVAPNGDLYCTLGIFSRSMVLKSAASNGLNTGTEGTWVDITPPYSNVVFRSDIAVAPSNPQRLYLVGQDSASSQTFDVFRSDDGGATWTSFPAPPAMNNGGASQNWFNLIIAVDPADANMVVAGGLRLARSIDGGQNWIPIANNVHVDQHVLLYNNNRLIVGNDGGIYSASNPSSLGSLTFVDKNNTYNVTQFYGADFHPTNPNYFLAGAQDNNTQRFNQPGINTTSPVSGGDGGIPHIDQTDGNLQISSFTFNSYFRSLNGGAFVSLSNTNSPNTGQFINPSDLDDVNKTLYAGDAAGRYYFVTGLLGTPFSSRPTVSAMGTRTVTAVRVVPNTANTVWLGCSRGNQQPMLLQLANAHTNNPIVSVNTVLSGMPGNANISCVEQNPANLAQLIVTSSNFGVNSIWFSTDGGTSFNSIEGNLPDMPVWWACFVPDNVQLNGVSGGNGGVLIGTELGVWFTTQLNGAATVWAPYANFPNVRATMVKYRASDRTVMVSTHGRGLWTTSLPLATGVSNITATPGFIRYISSMNQRLTIATGTTGSRRMMVELYDMSGKLVLRQQRPYQNDQVGIDGLPPGSYILRITGERGEVFARQIVR